ncbi:hypothetical protein F4778DRAFT_627821 [Xylariomycetidae sp. FL2044]|nr:hypothetical protein F4778DRAFT_627821 [Xylariomycetidae sp. FL2044]
MESIMPERNGPQHESSISDPYPSAEPSPELSTDLDSSNTDIGPCHKCRGECEMKIGATDANGSFWPAPTHRPWYKKVRDTDDPTLHAVQLAMQVETHEVYEEAYLRLTGHRQSLAESYHENSLKVKSRFGPSLWPVKKWPMSEQELRALSPPEITEAMRLKEEKEKARLEKSRERQRAEIAAREREKKFRARMAGKTAVRTPEENGTAEDNGSWWALDDTNGLDEIEKDTVMSGTDDDDTDLESTMPDDTAADSNDEQECEPEEVGIIQRITSKISDIENRLRDRQ